MACANPVSAAKLFMHLAPARAPAQPALPVLDFLLPRTSRRKVAPVVAAAATAAAAPAAITSAPRPASGSSPTPTRTTTPTRPAARSSSSSLSSSALQTARSMRAAAAAGSRMFPAARPGLSRRSPRHSSLSGAAFSYSTSRRYTQAVYNPQRDEDGNEMKLEITPRAAKVCSCYAQLPAYLPTYLKNLAYADPSLLFPSKQRLSDIMKKDSNPHLALRIQVESGGCHGFQYLMSLVTLPSALPSQPAAGAQPSEHPGEGADSGVVREDDTIFTYSKEEEAEAGLADPSSAPKIILDQPSLELLKGSKVDYTMELIGSQFKVVDNPMATSSCGCGTSFDLKSL